MPFGGPDWLALTPEAALEPELPICDPHHHFWDLRTERVPYQRYLLHELLADIKGGHNVRSTVFIEARSMYRADGPEDMRPVGEVEFVQGLAAASASGVYGPSRAAAAIVGHANLNLGERVAPVLEALQAASPNRFRGIRHSVTWDPHPEVENTAAHKQQGQLASDQFRAGARVLARMGFSLEGWLFFPQLPELADFARAAPDLPIILNHIGGLLRVGPYADRDDEVLATWRDGIAAVAACPNVTIKLGGIGMPRTGFDWHLRSKPIGSEELAASMAPFMNYCIEQFGPDRCMFESNFPVDKVSYSYNVLYNAFKRLSEGYSAAERAAMFHDTAARVYRIAARRRGANQMSDNAQKIIALDKQRMDAMCRQDIPTLNALLSDDLVYTHSSARLDTKQSLIGGMESGTTIYTAIEPSDVKAQDSGDAVVLTGSARIHVTSRGNPTSFGVRFTDVYVNKGGKWQMVTWQSTRLPE